MQKKNVIFPYIVLCLFLIAVIIFIGSLGWLGFLRNSLQVSFFPFGNFLQSPPTSTQLNKLKAENATLTQELAQEKLLKDDNKALRDQFNNPIFLSSKLLPSRVVGEPSAIPNISFPEELIIDKGIKSGVARGQVVIVSDNAIGQISQANDYFAKVMLISNKQFALSGKDNMTGAVGVIKGEGNGNILFDAVLLSDTLNVGDVVVSLGSQDISGKGFPPNIVIGKITGVEKNPSALFQSAQITPLIPLQKTSIVFVRTNL